MAVSTAGMVARRRFGEALKKVRVDARTAKGAPIKQLDAARAIRRKTIDRVSRFERGAAWPELAELQALLKLYGADIATSVRLETMLEAGTAITETWWQDFEDEFPESLIEFVAYEDSAREITTCTPNILPGLLQTREYGRTLTHYLAKSTAKPQSLDRSVELRARRRDILFKESRPAVEVLIGEAALRQKVGGPDVMLAQLDALLEDAAERGVSFRVIPFGANATLTYTWHMLSFGGSESPVAAFDAMTGMTFRKGLKEVRGLKGFLDDLRDLALSPTDSLGTIESIRKEMSRD
ncbi:DUF5753 domain-containing protein [Streptomyces anulatus]|uniref:DUF5753 domain-containing protein n=1 Tax=Streptomyces anulatus TaxID=1892 RepID=UPI0036CC1864